MVVYCWDGTKKKRYVSEDTYHRSSLVIVVSLCLRRCCCLFCHLVPTNYNNNDNNNNNTSPQKKKSRLWKGNQLLVYLSFSIFSLFDPFFSNTLTGLAGTHSPANTHRYTYSSSHTAKSLFSSSALPSALFFFSFPFSFSYPPYQHIPRIHTHTRSPRILLTHIEYPSSTHSFNFPHCSLTHSLTLFFLLGCFDPFLPIHYIRQHTH